MGPNTEDSKRSQKPTVFKLQNHTFEEKNSTAFNYELWRMAHSDVEDKSSARYFASSMLLHLFLAIAAATVAIPMMEDKQFEVVEFEINEGGASTSPTAALAPIPTSPLPEKIEKVIPSKDDVVVKAPAKTKAAKAAPAAAPPKVTAAARPPQASKANAKVQTFKTESPIAIPDNVDDIKAPDLDDSALNIATTKTQLDEQELLQDFNKVDESHRKQVLAVAQDLDSQSNQALSENEALAEKINSESAAEAEQIASYNASRRARDAQAIAAAQASERAAAARAAQEQAAAIKAAQARASEERAAMGSGSGRGAVRSLDQLKQRPGNPAPQYSSEERLQRQQGVVVFYAYINEAGTPSQFRMIHSTGHRNLDGKTLKALKQWRFYPGQAGWVEIPFQWTLKGGAKEMPALLRRK